jgi:hypothetical protein
MLWAIHKKPNPNLGFTITHYARGLHVVVPNLSPYAYVFTRHVQEALSLHNLQIQLYTHRLHNIP